MSGRIRTVCLIHSPLAPVFARLGVRVTSLDPPAGLASLAELLSALPEPPDCVIQQEHLARRLVLTDLAGAPCPVLYWARDPHLNFFWQRHQAGCFAAVAATQPHLTPAFREAGAPRAAWITWHGQARTFVPHADRPVALAFAGRITAERPRRRLFAEHLAGQGLARTDNAFGEALAAFHDAARLVPNECIAGEVNQRLFEAASSGCCLLAERTPPEVETLFVPGVEALYYDDVLELDEALDFVRRHPARAEALGRAALAAVAERHLPEHRVRALLDLAGAAEARPGPARAAEATALTVWTLVRSGQLVLPEAAVRGLLAGAPATPAVVAARLVADFEAGRVEAVREGIAACLAGAGLAGDLGCAVAGCLAAWRLGDPDSARLVYLAWCRAAGRSHGPRLDGVRDALLFFARELAAAGRSASPGQPFDPDRQLPGDAAQCLMTVLAGKPDDLETLRRLEGLMRGLPGRQMERLGCLSALSLRRRDDWRLGVELGLADLAAFRRRAGLDELALAGATAARLGQADRFARRLAQVDPSGRLRRALAARMSG